MSEQPKKQFLLVVDEMHTGILSMLMPLIKFVEVQAIGLTDNANVLALVMPVQKPPEAPKEEVKPDA